MRPKENRFWLYKDLILAKRKCCNGTYMIYCCVHRLFKRYRVICTARAEDTKLLPAGEYAISIDRRSGIGDFRRVLKSLV